MPMKEDRFRELIVRLYTLVDEFEVRFPGRKFTPDGHLFGSIGEAIAEHHFNLKLRRHSEAHVDAATSDGRFVQIKATQRQRAGSVDVKPGALSGYLLVIRVHRTGVFDVIYNGPGNHVVPLTGRLKRREDGAFSIAVSRLEAANKQVPEADRLPHVHT